MRIGIFMTPQWRPGADLALGFKELIQQAQTARDCGFSSVLVGQHMVTGPDMQMFQTVPLMSRLLPHIEGMQIGPGVLLLSMINPVMAAEEGATIDWMSDGNYVLAGGLGYRPEEFQAMGSKKSQRVSRLEESVEIIKGLWTNDRVSFQGRHFQLDELGSSVRPKQSPRPPIWLGGDVEAAVRRAARIADAWLGSPTADIEQLQRLLGVYVDERTISKATVSPNPVIRECYVSDDSQQVERVRNGPLLYKYEAYAGWGHNDTQGSSTENSSFADGFELFCKDRFLFGSTGQVHEDIVRYGELLGTDHLILRVQWPGLEQPQVIANIKKIGEIIARL